jgi:hypothetical protein
MLIYLRFEFFHLDKSKNSFLVAILVGMPSDLLSYATLSRLSTWIGAGLGTTQFFASRDPIDHFHDEISAVGS